MRVEAGDAPAARTPAIGGSGSGRNGSHGTNSNSSSSSSSSVRPGVRPQLAKTAPPPKVVSASIKPSVSNPEVTLDVGAGEPFQSQEDDLCDIDMDDELFE